MRGSGSMRRVWMGASLALAVLSFYPAWTGWTGWLVPGISFGVFLLFALEPWFLTWELRWRGEELQITDQGILRRLARGDSEYVRWSELREISIVMTQGVNLSEDYFYLLAGAGTSGVMVGQKLAVSHDLISHLNKLPGFDHRGIASALASPVNQRFTLWRAPALQGEVTVLDDRVIPHDPPSRLTLH